METTVERRADLPRLRGHKSDRRIAATAGADVTRGKAPWPGRGDRQEGPQRTLPCTVGGAEWCDRLSWVELS
ncbi:hypothetical protein MUK42_22961 [Musa troglodytarum]|uniref:Uncharacterized protein n=1 Tax=Musa troglodytarum TaxID=320322 RepID=A0A9E7KCH4_9LILI|nr:hypothetical protein MUK42_22961 [Musa troglodytarum]